MVFVKATPESEAGEMPGEQLLAEMLAFNEGLVRAGVMRAGEGLHPSSEGVRVSVTGERTVTRGPFDATRELVAGFWIWEVESLDDAIAWAKKIPNPDGTEGEVELRPIFEAEDFGDELTPELREREERIREQTEAQG
jgi:hypothetical protein